MCNCSFISCHMPNMCQKYYFCVVLYPSCPLFSLPVTQTYLRWTIIQGRVFLCVLKHVWRGSLRITTVAQRAKEVDAILKMLYIQLAEGQETPSLPWLLVYYRKPDLTSEIIVSVQGKAKKSQCWLIFWLPSRAQNTCIQRSVSYDLAHSVYCISPSCLEWQKRPSFI